MIHGRFFLVSFSCQQSLSGYLKQVVVVQWEDSRRHSLRLENLPPDLQVLALHHLSCSIFWLTHRSTSFDILNEYMISVARNCYRFRCGLLTVYVIKTKQKQSLSLFLPNQGAHSLWPRSVLTCQSPRHVILALRLEVLGCGSVANSTNEWSLAISSCTDGFSAESLGI